VLAVQRALERGALRGLLARVASSAWASACAPSVVRRVVLPAGVRVVCIGGATLGGSGKTPLAIACATELAAAGARVALVGHAYRANPRRARVVTPDDALADVGDEALLAARALAASPAPSASRACVVVAPRRADAIALAARHADVLVLDGVAQTAPRRASLALLAVDPEEPWGHAAALPPCGDLRAPIAALLDACDEIVPVGEREGSAVAASLSPCSRRVGLLCALARPERVLRSLARHGVTPLAVVRAADHGPFAPAALADARALSRSDRLDVWLATPKCALHLRGFDLGAPLEMLDHRFSVGPALLARLLTFVVA
jgi:tetraacyldisaccharide 4'-kinase